MIYERLPDFYFNCEMIGRTSRGCEKQVISTNNSGEHVKNRDEDVVDSDWRRKVIVNKTSLSGSFKGVKKSNVDDSMRGCEVLRVFMPKNLVGEKDDGKSKSIDNDYEGKLLEKRKV